MRQDVEMLCALIALLPGFGFKDAITDVPAKESAWVYSHASDPSGDEYLRIWGVGGLAIPEPGGDSTDFSFGYLKFSLAGLPEGKPNKVILILHNVSPPAFDSSDAKATPLQARALIGAFDASSWSFDRVGATYPGTAKTVFGSGKVAVDTAGVDAKEVDIDLLVGPGDFLTAVAKAKSRSPPDVSIALTSAIEPSSVGGARHGVYKIYSAAAKDKSLRPVLRFIY